MNWIAVFVGGGLGSVARFGMSKWSGLGNISFPMATLISNFTSSLILGVFIGISSNRPAVFSTWRFLVAIGFCGGFSTFSTFSAETLELMKHGMFPTAIVNAGVNLAGTLLMVWSGIWIGRMIS